MDQTILYLIPIAGIIALIFTFWRSAWVAKQDPGNDKMQTIAGHIQKGAMAFFKS